MSHAHDSGADNLSSGVRNERIDRERLGIDSEDGFKVAESSSSFLSPLSDLLLSARPESE